MNAQYSEAALAKQAALKAREAAGEVTKWSDLFGILEPATQPADSERCVCCGLDARASEGGNGRYCWICIGRGHDEVES